MPVSAAMRCAWPDTSTPRSTHGRASRQNCSDAVSSRSASEQQACMCVCFTVCKEAVSSLCCSASQLTTDSALHCWPFIGHSARESGQLTTCASSTERAPPPDGLRCGTELRRHNDCASGLWREHTAQVCRIADLSLIYGAMSTANRTGRYKAVPSRKDLTLAQRSRERRKHSSVLKQVMINQPRPWRQTHTHDHKELPSEQSRMLTILES